jgi:pimeloyl-ACP methyl ester carboxylesterase
MTSTSTSHTVPLREERFTGGSGLELVATVAGEPGQPAVILLHGGGQTRHSWRGTVHLLAELGYHVIAYDARGHGDSQWSPDAQYAYDRLADDLDAVMTTLTVKPALIGASMGGMTSLSAMGRSTSAMAQALVLVDIAPRANPEGVKRIHDFMTANPDGFTTIDEAADAVSAYNPHRPRPKDPSGLMKNLRLHDNGRLYWHWDPKIFSVRTPEQRNQSANRLLDLCENIRIPSLLVRGAQSDVVTQSAVDELLGRMPHLEVRDVSGAGHMIAGDKNDAFNDAILDFLAQHLAPGKPVR